MEDNNSIIVLPGKVEANRTGLVFNDGISYREWEFVGAKLRDIEGAIHWWIGDWLNYGENKWGETYTQALEVTDYEESTLRNDKWVASSIDLSRRRDNLPWSQHAEVASLPPKQQDVLLDRAVDEGWTVKRIRAEASIIKNQSLLTASNKTSYSGLSVIHGDMLDVLPGLGKFNLVLTDPPYGVTDYSWDQLKTSEWLDAIIPHLDTQYNLFWFCSPQFAADIELIFRIKGLPIQSRIVWHRRNMAMGSKARNKFVDSWEMILHAGNRELNFPSEWSDAWFDVQTFAVPQTNFTDQKLHPTQKPIELIERLVAFGSYPGDKILDPFAGSGTTGAACPRDRECTLIERDDDYTSVIEARLGIKRQ